MPVSILAYPMVQRPAMDPRQKNQTHAKKNHSKICAGSLSSVPLRHTIVLHDAGGAADSDNC
ncbi:hypothetical protein N7452_005412 [Penicillium brevicompactum]|uniref:Uncharacterized protein n=1 Tax=Penicillium brevicompactum TaxID=5074 RepID=A0A9W9QLB1_PENBR|nr:hypothetical protein N7452_005412 [Penicillium brevicompactum]